jgi:hypothetical protein
VSANRGSNENAWYCSKRGDNAHKIEELEVVYPWHPCFGRVVHIHDVIEQRASGVFHCSLDDISRRWLELPKWMFDRATCLVIRMAASPRIDTAALIALKTCLADALGAGLCRAPYGMPLLPEQGGAPATRIRELSGRHKCRSQRRK